jgi:hypothetical protein
MRYWYFFFIKYLHLPSLVLCLSMSISDHHGPIKIRDAALVNVSTASPDYDFLKATVSDSHRINIRHPAYAPDDDILLTLDALDHCEGGIHHGFALGMCAIIADNCDGYLTSTRYGDRIEAGFDDVLKAGRDYYYHVPHPGKCSIGRRFGRASSVTSAKAVEPIDQIDHNTIPYKWPVVPTFQDWKFPNRMPEVWTRWRGSSRPQTLPSGTASQSNYTTLVRARDFSCRISQHYTGTEVAHLCPESERDWFITNNMQQYRKNLNSDPDHLLGPRPSPKRPREHAPNPL